MVILVIGSEKQQTEARKKFGAHECLFARNVGEAKGGLAKAGVVLDFVSAEDASQLAAYTNRPPFVFFDTSRVPLSRLTIASGAISFGFCGLPTLLDRPLLEVTVRNEKDGEALGKICHELNTGFQIVADRTGMVTPRIVCMIINEAFSTVEDGTATRDDIDLAMKLGTNYPYGPFEWCRMIGPGNVVRVLQSVHKDTGDERYRVCRLLEKEVIS